MEHLSGMLQLNFLEIKSMVMQLTYFCLYSSAGIASTYAACKKGQNGAIVKDAGGYNSMNVAAHELAHR